MIISRTPLRISFVGGGSDIQSYYRLNTGAVISTAINKYIYITVNKKFDNKIRASYSKTEIVDSIDQVQHPLIRECLKMTEIDSGIEVTSMSDIPSEGTGLGSSSSYTVGLLNALYAYKGRHVSAEQLAQEACKIEIDILKNPIGKQDQYIAAYGGIQHIQFNPDESVYVDPIICSSETKSRLQENLLLLYTGLTRSSYPILAKQSINMEKNEEKRNTMIQMVEFTKEMRKALSENMLDSFGMMLDKNWLLKKTLTQDISSEKIDFWYEKAKKGGATGGKILGAGGGGFLLLYAEVKNHIRIINSLPELTPMSFKFEPQGSKIIFVDKI
ncbi:MAG: GHMP kinase [Candidatus Levybacteria bacterium]|nr:GHMP kinase [Candidatus Levybacteria bacterium]